MRKRNKTLPRGVVVFGSSITHGRANGATVFFQGLCRAFARAGLVTTFAQQQQTGSGGEAVAGEYRVRHYRNATDVASILAELPRPGLVLKFVACGSMDADVEETILDLREDGDRVAYVDGDAPVSLARLHCDEQHYSRRNIPRFDGVLALAGGQQAVDELLALGARRACWGYCGIDQRFWRRYPSDGARGEDVWFVGNRLGDREERVREFVLRPAAARPDLRFVLAGDGWQGSSLPGNVHPVGHLTPVELRRAYVSAGFVLNVNREPMVRYGYSPASRLFEATACEACVISDVWPGVEQTFAEGREILLAAGGEEVVRVLQETPPAKRREIGLAARRRVELDYTCETWIHWALRTLAAWDGLPTNTEVTGREVRI